MLRLLPLLLLLLASCPIKVADIEGFGRSCDNDDDCSGGDVCRDLGDGNVCVPVVGEGEGEEGEGETRCSANGDCPEGQGCVDVGSGTVCQPLDGSGLRVQFGGFVPVPRLTGRTASGLVVRHAGVVAKPWITGKSNSFTLIGGDLK